MKINLLNRRFMYLAMDDSMVVHHFDGSFRKKLVLIVKRTRAYPWYMARKMGPLWIVHN